MLIRFVWLLPWLAALAILPLAFRRKPRLSREPVAGGDETPFVSIIVPARDEAQELGACVATLLRSSYPKFEVIIVDDRSRDGTREIALAMADRSDGKVQLVHGEPLPDGWFGKPWACWQGFRQSRGELLLFTDADTRHEPTLLAHAVGALRARGASLVSCLPRQLMQSFWERVILPHVFLVISWRYANTMRVNREKNPRDVVANGQFMLFRRDAYVEIGGHEAVRADVVEDLMLAQRITASGRRLVLAHADDLMATRMYRSLGDIVEGWSKNVAIGARRTVSAWLRPFVPWLLSALIVSLWVAPPVALVVFGLGGPAAAFRWSLLVVALSVLHWAIVLGRMRVPLGYVASYPLGALAAAAIIARSAWRGDRVVEWKGRAYGPGGHRIQRKRRRRGRSDPGAPE